MSMMTNTSYLPELTCLNVDDDEHLILVGAGVHLKVHNIHLVFAGAAIRLNVDDNEHLVFARSGLLASRTPVVIHPVLGPAPIPVVYLHVGVRDGLHLRPLGVLVDVKLLTVPAELR